MVPNRGNFGGKVTFDTSTMSQINLKISDELNARIESEAGSKRERASWIRDLIRDELGPDTDSKPDTGHYPEKKRDLKIYESLLNRGGDDVLTGYVLLKEHEPEIAMDTRISGDDIYRSLKRMEKNNHVRLEEGMQANDPVTVRARPPSADPDQWTRARDRDRDIDPSVFQINCDNPSSARDRLLRDIEAEKNGSGAPEVPADD